MDYIILVAVWAIYLFLHSYLASNTVKKYFSEHFRLHGSRYRLLYSIFSTLGLFGIGWILDQMSSKTLFEFEILKYVSLLMAIIGVIILYLSFKHLSAFEFLGLNAGNSEGRLVTKGIHAKVRHPIYSGTILIMIGFFLYSPSDLMLITNLVIFIYLPIGIHFEEKNLIQEFGNAYLQYRRKTPSLIPKI